MCQKQFGTGIGLCYRMSVANWGTFGLSGLHADVGWIERNKSWIILMLQTPNHITL